MRRPLRAALGAYHGQQRAQSLLDVRLDRDLGGIVLCQLPVALADLEHGDAFRQRVHAVEHRHAQDVGAQERQQVVGLQRGAHLLLVASQRTEKRRVLGEILRRVRHGLLINRRTQQLGQLGCLRQSVVGGQLVARDEDRLTRFEQTPGQPFECLVGGTVGGIHARGFTQIERSLGVEDVARQTDEHRPGRRRRGDLRCAVHDARQILHPGDLDRPLHHRLRDRDQRIIEQRFHQTVALFLLPGGDQQR